MRWLYLFFFVTPIVEMYLLFTVSDQIGALVTIGLVMLTAVIGVTILRQQGMQTLTRGMGKLNSGQVPAQEMTEGVLLGAAGALLLTPGFLTDALGFWLLLPPTRQLTARFIMQRIKFVNLTQSGPQSNPKSGPAAGDDSVIEGEFKRKP